MSDNSKKDSGPADGSRPEDDGGPPAAPVASVTPGDERERVEVPPPSGPDLDQTREDSESTPVAAIAPAAPGTEPVADVREDAGDGAARGPDAIEMIGPEPAPGRVVPPQTTASEPGGPELVDEPPAERPPPRRPLKFSRIVDLVLLLVVALAVLAPGIARLPLTDRDEARFVQASRQMIESGDYLDIRFQDEPRYKKPILIYWLQSAAALASGQGADAPLWVFRLPSIIGAVLSVLLTYAIGLVLGGRRAGLVAALLACSTVALGIEARLAKTDGALLATVLAAEWALASIWMSTAPTRKFGRNAVFWTALGLGVLLKGPVILVAVVPPLAVMLAMDRSWRRLRALDPLKGAVWMLLLVAPWLVAIGVVSEGRFFVDSIGGDVITKIVGGQESHGAPPGTHTLVAILTFWPLSAFLPMVFALPALARLGPERRRAVLFVVAWVLPGWLVMEAVPTKLPNYVLPFMPGLAVLVGIAAAVLPVEPKPWIRRWSVRIGFGFVFAGAVVLGFGLNAAFVLAEGRADPLGLAIGLLAIVAGFVAARLLMRGRFAAGLAATVVTAGLATSLGFAVLLPAASSIWLSDRLAEAVAAAKTCADPQIVSVRYSEPSLVVRLGSGIRFLQAEEAGQIFAAADCAVAIVPARDEAVFSAAAGTVAPATVVTGRNLNGLKLQTIGIHVRPAPPG